MQKNQTGFHGMSRRLGGNSELYPWPSQNRSVLCLLLFALPWCKAPPEGFSTLSQPSAWRNVLARGHGSHRGHPQAGHCHQSSNTAQSPWRLRIYGGKISQLSKALWDPMETSLGRGQACGGLSTSVHPFWYLDSPWTVHPPLPAQTGHSQQCL